MWVLFAFVSAALLGVYDVFKKISLNKNAVIPVLFLNVVFCCVIFLPLLIISFVAPEATQPILTLVGALLIFGERLNLYQWLGVLVAIISFLLLSQSGKKEGIHFAHNKWIFLIVISIIMGTVSGLYDKFIMTKIDRMNVQVWYDYYQLVMMAIILLAFWFPRRKKTTPFHWNSAIPMIAVFLVAADFFYYFALSDDSAMISIVSLVRRSSVVVSFSLGALYFKERNLKAKAIDLFLVLIGMLLIFMGSR